MKRFLALICTMLILLCGCTDIQSTPEDTTKESSVQTEVVESNEDEEQAAEGTKISAESASIETTEDDGYRVIEVAAGDLSGYREANVKVDIGFGDREYWAYTNEYGQLVRVTAKQIILQDDATEPVNASGRYCNDEAKVPGVEDPDLDEGHVIADSLGGVSNAYNITPQNSTLNRHGDQAYMEKVIRDAGGCSDFEAIITYPDTTTQIPNHYKYTYTILGNVIVDEFDNVNPDDVNKNQASNSSPAPAPAPKQPAQTSTPVEGSVWIPASGSKYHNKPSCGRMNPKNSTLNRHGDQAYMEKVIRDAGGCSDFEAIITYPDTTTQIPNHYKYTYTILGNVIVDEFDNVNPDDVNKNQASNSSPAPAPAPKQPAQTSTPVEGSVWIPASGSKYHNKPSCGRMNPSTAKQISKSEAEAMGYEPCKKCY